MIHGRFFAPFYCTQFKRIDCFNSFKIRLHATTYQNAFIVDNNCTMFRKWDRKFEINWKPYIWNWIIFFYCLHGCEISQSSQDIYVLIFKSNTCSESSRVVHCTGKLPGVVMDWIPFTWR
jgi:hypothetical protein